MTEIDYEVTRSERATKPRIDVNIREINVVLPEGCDIDPEEVVEEKKEWIERKKRKYDKYLEEAPERNFEEGEEFFYLGKPRRLEFEDTNTVRIEEENLVVPESSKENAEEVLESFFESKAREHIQPKLQSYKGRMNVEYNSVSFKNQRTLWGSCSSKENLSFNWRLIMAPPEAIEYVIVHELAHLKEKNHTKRFWRIVEEHHDSHKESAKWLEKNATKLIFRRDDL